MKKVHLEDIGNSDLKEFLEIELKLRKTHGAEDAMIYLFETIFDLYVEMSWFDNIIIVSEKLLKTMIEHEDGLLGDVYMIPNSSESLLIERDKYLLNNHTLPLINYGMKKDMELYYRYGAVKANDLDLWLLKGTSLYTSLLIEKGEIKDVKEVEPFEIDYKALLFTILFIMIAPLSQEIEFLLWFVYDEEPVVKSDELFFLDYTEVQRQELWHMFLSNKFDYFMLPYIGVIMIEAGILENTELYISELEHQFPVNKIVKSLRKDI